MPSSLRAIGHSYQFGGNEDLKNSVVPCFAKMLRRIEAVTIIRCLSQKPDVPSSIFEVVKAILGGIVKAHEGRHLIILSPLVTTLLISSYRRNGRDLSRFSSLSGGKQRDYTGILVLFYKIALCPVYCQVGLFI